MDRKALWIAIRIISIAMLMVGALIAAPMSLRVAQAASPPTYETMATATRTYDFTWLNISRPPGTEKGDLLILILAKDGIGSIYTPSGWTQMVHESTGGAARLGVFYKVAGSSEPSYYTISWSGYEEAVGAILRYSGAHTSDPIDIFGLNTGTSSSPTAPTLTTTHDDTRILRIYGADHDDLSGTPYPPGHDGRFNMESSSGDGTVSAGAADTTQASAGPTGTAAFTLAASEEWVAATVAIRGKIPFVPFVPEASTVILFGSGLASLAGYASLRLRAWRKREE